MKRVVSLIMATLMCFCAAVPSFADGEIQDYVYSDSSYNNVIGGVSFIEYAQSRGALEALMAEEVVPSGIVFNVDSELFVTNEAGGRLGYTLRDALVIIDGTARPVVRISDENTARAVSTFFEYSGVKDYFIMSDSADILKLCRDEYAMGGMIFDMTETVTSEPTTEELREISAALSAAGANVCLLSPEVLTNDVVKYLYIRTFYVWCEADDDTDLTTAAELILTGIFGVVGYDTDVFCQAATEYLLENTLTRTPVNVGHRGSVEFAQENSVEGCVFAEQQGADAVEIDIFVTTDGEIILNHNPQYGSIDIESSTFAQVREAAPNLPTLREVYEGIGRETVIFLEIKSTKPEIVAAIDKLTAEYGFYDKLVIISFHMNQLILCRETMPQVPCSFLIQTEESDVEYFMDMLRPHGLSLDIAHYMGGFMFEEQSVYAAARAFPILLWTFVYARQIESYMLLGYLGITTDIPYAFEKIPEKVEGRIDAEGDIIPGKTYDVNYDLLAYNGEILKGRNVTVTSPDEGVVIDGRQVTFEKAGEYTIFVSVGYRMVTDTYYYMYDAIHVSVPAEGAVSGEITETEYMSAFRMKPTGDVNGDGAVDIKDATVIIRSLGGYDVEADMANADINGDSAVNLIDAVMILQQRAGY